MLPALLFGLNFLRCNVFIFLFCLVVFIGFVTPRRLSEDEPSKCIPFFRHSKRDPGEAGAWVKSEWIVFWLLGHGNTKVLTRNHVFFSQVQRLGIDSTS